MIAQNAIKGFPLGRVRTRRGCNHVHAIRGHGAAGSQQLAVDLDHTGVTGLDGSKLGMIANLRYFDSATVDQID
jgi:hypothetical protein